MRAHKIGWMGSILGLAAVLAGGCGGKEHILTVAGSTAFHPTVLALAERYAERHPALTVAAQSVGSAAGRQAVLSGAADIGTLDAPGPADWPTNLTATVVAWDAIAVIVHPDNPVTELTRAQVRELFAGGVDNWRAVGGADHPINRVLREQGSGTRRIFEEHLELPEPEGNVVIGDTSGAVREIVANDRFAIGYVSRGALTDRVRALRIDGETCDEERILARRYPLAHPVWMVTRGAPVGKAADFIGFVLSDEGRATIRQAGFVAP